MEARRRREGEREGEVQQTTDCNERRSDGKFRLFAAGSVKIDSPGPSG